jgi:hypothetical protein
MPAHVRIEDYIKDYRKYTDVGPITLVKTIRGREYEVVDVNSAEGIQIKRHHYVASSREFKDRTGVILSLIMFSQRPIIITAHAVPSLFLSAGGDIDQYIEAILSPAA